MTLPDLVRDIADHRVSSLLVIGGNPVYSAPADSRARAEVRARRRHAVRRPLRERDRKGLDLVRPRPPLPRVVGRRAGLRRHGVARSAAHRSAVRWALARPSSWPLLAATESPMPAISCTARGPRARGGADFPHVLLRFGSTRVHRRAPLRRGSTSASTHRACLCNPPARASSGRERALVRARLPARRGRVRRPLRQQWLAARVPQATHQADVGQRRAAQPRHRRTPRCRE